MGHATEYTKLLDDSRKISSSEENNGVQKKYSSVSLIKLYKYSSVWDKFWLVIGTIVILLGGASFSYFAINLGHLIKVVISYVQAKDSNTPAGEMQKIIHDFDVGTFEFAVINCILATLVFIASYIATLIFNYTAVNQTFRIRNLFLFKVLNQDISWHDTNLTGDFASRMSDDIPKIEEAIGEKMAILLYYVGVALGCVIQALLLGWELALICMLSIPVTAGAMALIIYVSSKLAIKESDAYGAAGAIAEEVLTALRTVVAFGGEKSEVTRYYKLLKYACKNNIKRALFNGIGEGTNTFILFSNYALGFWCGIQLIVRDRHVPEDEAVYNPSTMISVFFSVFIATLHINMASILMEPFGVAKSAAFRIFQIIDSQPIINRSKNNGVRYGKVSGKVTFSNVHFEYPTRSDVQVLQGLSLVVNPGETVALVGSSGCGKSTCIQLIQRFYDPRVGNIYIDDYKLKDLDLTWIRNCVGVVGQEPVLFEGTIEENIRLGCKSATMEDVEKAAVKANADSFIKHLPQGYNTLVGERGTQLSGGQKQRVAIARALVRKPSILLLDEATSALDINSEAIVQAALEVASKDCTTIIVAHRLSTVKKADRIVVISEGRVVEQGTHDYLMSQRGAYYELVTAQVSDYDLEKDEDTVAPLVPFDHLETVRKDSLESDYEKKSSSHIGLYLKETLQQQNRSSKFFWEILKYNSPEWWAILIGCVASFFVGSFMPVFATIYGGVINILASVDDDFMLSEIDLYAMYFLILAIVTFILCFTQYYFLGIAGEKLTMRLRGQMFQKMLSLEMGYFDRENHGVGALCGLLSAEASSVQGASGHRIGTVLSSLSTILWAVVVCFYFEWRITLIALCFSPLIVFAGYFEKKMVKKETSTFYEALQNSTKVAVEAINGIRTVVSLGCEKVFHGSYVAELIPYQKVVQRNTLVRALVFAITRTLMLFAYSACFYYGSILIKEENLNYSTMFIVAMAIVTSSWALAKGFAYTPNLQKGVIAAGRIIEILNLSPLIRDGSDDSLEKWRHSNVKYDNVEFSYPTRPRSKVLRGFNFSVMQGKTVALVGPSGCGKSTVIQLLERFYDPTSGTISVDDKSISSINLTSLRSQLGIVSQEPNLFSKTISENIAYGDNSRTVTQEEIVEAARAANIHDFIVSLPLGYDTKLGERGTQLSGGQKQRIAIARALVRNPRILLLDEATSALDAESEKIVQEALDKARLGRTCITIAHRLSTIQDADVIYVINRGKVVEMGSHQELLNLKGIYYNLNRLQL